MSNVIRSFFVAPVAEGETSDAVAIDSNSLIDERMAEIEQEYERQRLAAEEAARVHIVEEPLLDEEGNPVYDEDGNPVMQQYEVHDEPGDDFTDMATLLGGGGFDPSMGSMEELPTEGEYSGEEPEFEPEPAALPEETIEALMAEAREEAMAAAKEEAEALLAEAGTKADAILADAEGQAAGIRENAMNEGREEGFQQGTAEAMANLENEKQLLQDEREQMHQEYLAKEEEMERSLVDVISRVLEKVFRVEFGADREVIFHLIDQAMSHTEGSNELQIRANEENAAYIRERLDTFKSRLGDDVQLDLITDPLMRDGECLIETDGGMFDCGFDTELKNLMNKIRMLA